VALLSILNSPPEVILRSPETDKVAVSEIERLPLAKTFKLLHNNPELPATGSFVTSGIKTS
jgi:hypothetical protein